jgi:hypothetical protein
VAADEFGVLQLLREPGAERVGDLREVAHSPSPPF